MANGSVLTNFSMKATDAAGITYINEASSKTITINAAAPNVSKFTQSIPTTAAGTALDLGSVAANGVCWLQNCDAANYVEVGVQVSGAFYPLIKLKAGEAWPIRVSTGVTPYARANTSAVVLKQPIMDD